MKEKILEIKKKFLDNKKNFLKNIFNTSGKIIDFHNNTNKNIGENLGNINNNTKNSIIDLHQNTKKIFGGFFDKIKIKNNENKIENKIENKTEEKIKTKIELEKNELKKEELEILNKKEEIKELNKTEKKLKIKNNFSDIFEDEKGDDIFSGLLKQKNTISISDNSENVLNKNTVKDVKEKINLNFFIEIFHTLNKYAFYLFLSLLAGLTSIYLFFIISLDSNNYIFSYFGGETIGSKIENQKDYIDNKHVVFSKIESSIKKMTGDVPSKIYIKTPYFNSLDEKLKEKIFVFYNSKTGKIKKMNASERNELVILFNNTPEFLSLKNTFIKQDVLNSIINNRIYWKSVYKDLMDVTNNVFKYNELINYVTYSNFSVDSDGKISVSGTVSDPSGKVFSQLFRLEKAINESVHFSGVSINNFNKVLNPDKNIGGMMTSINLRFNYIK